MDAIEDARQDVFMWTEIAEEIMDLIHSEEACDFLAEHDWTRGAYQHLLTVEVNCPWKAWEQIWDVVNNGYSIEMDMIEDDPMPADLRIFFQDKIIEAQNRLIELLEESLNGQNADENSDE